MAKQQCACGAVFRFSESSIGKRAKCKHCGEVFLLTGEYSVDTIPIADESPSFGTGFVEDMRGATDDAVPPITDAAAVYASAGDDSDGAQSKSYSQDLRWTLLFPLSPGNWASCGVLCLGLLLVSFLGMGSLVGLILGLLVTAYYVVYQLAVVVSAANGDEDLPALESDDLSAESLAGGLCKWIGSWAVVLLPVVVYCASVGRLVPSGIIGGVGGIASGFMDDPVAVGLLGVGMFTWPMVILCVAIGGFSSLIRLDLIVRTIVRTLPIYLLTVAIYFGAHYAGNALDGLQTTAAMPVVNVLVVVTSVYAEIVAMRAIGLYYHHFKHRFLWDWG